MTASDLSSSLNAAIAAADFGARLVIWGIAVEAIDLIVKCGGDCPSIAAQISAILQMAKWECSVFPTSKPVPVGISVNFCFTNEDLDAGYAAEVQNGWRDVKAGRALVSELNAAGVDAIENDMGADRITTLKINGLVILVGAKPILLDADIFRHEKIMQSVKTLPELYKEQDKSFDLQNKKYKTVNGGGMFGGERVKLP